MPKREWIRPACIVRQKLNTILAWKVEYTKAAREQLKKLPRDVSLRITKYMDKRAALLPREYGKAMTGNYSGFWRYRVGDYRVICSLHDDVLMIEVIRVGHRSDVYKN